MEGGRDAEAVVRAYLAALNRADADAAVACVSEDFINEHTATLGETVRGREAYRGRLGEFLQKFRNLHYDIEKTIVAGADVAVAYRLSASWRSAGADASAGRPFVIRGMFRFRVEAGRIVHRVDYWDSAEFQRQVSGASAGG
jgi:steroid delta-isomerase-like uncharacterized protein